jgi:hypothetical protein
MNSKRIIKMVVNKTKQVQREKEIRRTSELITKNRIVNDIKKYVLEKETAYCCILP